MRARTLPAAALIALAFSGPAAAGFGGADAGTAGAQFLKLGAGARAEGMAEAYTAVADEATAMYWNPAALSRIKGNSANLSYSSLLGGVKHQFIGYGGKPWGWGNLGAAAQYVSRPSITETDSTGLATGRTFTPNDAAFSVGCAKASKGGALSGGSFGVTARYIQSTITRTAYTFAADLGLLSPPVSVRGKALRLALVAQNLGPGLKFQTERDPLPSTLRLGSSLSSATNDWVVAFDASAPRDESPYASLGAEYRYQHDPTALLSARLGFNSRTWSDVEGLSGVTFGLGAELHRLGFDYSFVPFGRLGMTHRISLSFSWGDQPAQIAVPTLLELDESPKKTADNAAVHFSRAQAHLARRSLEEAKAELRLAMDALGEDDPRRVAYFEQTGQISLLQNEVETAIEFYQRAVDSATRLRVQGPLLARIHAGMAMCLDAAGKPASAIMYYEQALKIGPSTTLLPFVQGQLKKLKEN